MNMERFVSVGKLLLRAGTWPLALLLAGAVAETAERRASYCTMQYAPVCALIQVKCVRAPCPSVKRTFGNACLARLAGAQILHRGRCAARPDRAQTKPPTEHDRASGLDDR